MPTREYDLIALGTGSAMSIVDAALRLHPDWRAAVIDKDEPGGICLTRGCIPSKLLLYPAEVVRAAQRASEFGIEVDIKRIAFDRVMDRMRGIIGEDIDAIRQGLSSATQIDYFPAPAHFTAPYTFRAGNETLHAPFILLGLGSAPLIPAVPGLGGVGYLTSDTVLQLKSLPAHVAILGGGYIAAEYGHFFASMGAQVTIIGRNPRFLPAEEPEVSEAVAHGLGKRLRLLTNREVVRVERILGGKKRLTVRERGGGATSVLVAAEILVAAGRGPTTGSLQAERGGIALDEHGWVRVNEFLETSQKNVWALGDATGRLPFKHKANYDARVVYQNALQGGHVAVDYHAVPHAVFTEPEVAGVGLTQAEAVGAKGTDGVMIGFYRYRDTAKGQAMAERDGFVKLIVDGTSHALLGGHIVGPQASVLIQEVVTQMYAPGRSVDPIWTGMHIHPALSEVVERAAGNLMNVAEYARLRGAETPAA
ncbi:MAG TPA: dihydrolipoyl dehydrogenase [Thermoplasmata archaeon]|nr:dihydrolipoyl dehydrogenase [Thermoplasmata archaeon]